MTSVITSHYITSGNIQVLCSCQVIHNTPVGGGLLQIQAAWSEQIIRIFLCFFSLPWLSAVSKAIKIFREFVWLMSLFLEAGGKRSVYSYKEKKKTRDFLQAHAGEDEGKTSKFTL